MSLKPEEIWLTHTCTSRHKYSLRSHRHGIIIYKNTEKKWWKTKARDFWLKPNLLRHCPSRPVKCKLLFLNHPGSYFVTTFKKTRKTSTGLLLLLWHIYTNSAIKITNFLFYKFIDYVFQTGLPEMKIQFLMWLHCFLDAWEKNKICVHSYHSPF